MSGSRGNVLIVEDEPDAAEPMSALIAMEGFRPVVRGTAADGLTAFSDLQPVAVILDWTLPDAPGIEVCRSIRARDQVVPIIFASGRDDETSIAQALEAGANDYLVKPVRLWELLARLESCLRWLDAVRADAASAASLPERGPGVLRFGEVELDLSARVVRVGGQPVGLGSMEFKLLDYLARNTGIAVSRDQIMSEVYGYDADIGTERVDLLVKRLRGKLGDQAGGLISAVTGYGYRLDRRAPERPS